MDFAGIPTNGLLNVVCKVVVFDQAHDEHLMMKLHDGTLFHFEGLLDAGFDTYTILQGRLTQQYPFPKVCKDPGTQILSHSIPSWDNLFSLIDLCAGFGGLAQGAIAAGWEVTVAVDQNPKMVGLYTKVSNAHAICGDFGSLTTLHDIWKHSHGARAL